MTSRHLLTAVSLALAASAAHAAVTPAEAARLKADLTPLGAEKAGNKDGSIPAWTGGHTTPIAGDKPGGRRGDPFKDEKPLLSISAKNVAEYADKLTDGTKGMFKKYPDYRIDVYPTHRTAAAPQWVYDNTARNAVGANVKDDVIEGAFGGIPFPIPKTGAEVMWNHALRWRGTSVQLNFTQYQLTGEGRAVLTSDITASQEMPYYFKDGDAAQFGKTGTYWQIRLATEGPAIRAGEGAVVALNIDGNKDQIWSYLPGQRRVRKVPTACCDTPAPSTAGIMSFDEIEVWSGRQNRFDWSIVGKKEMYIPYNGNRLLQPKTDAAVIGKSYLNPDHMRWELHRVWVVEAKLKEGQRHQAPRSRYYCDEDTWICVLGDRWDARGELWKTMWNQTFVAPDLPGNVIGAFGFNDLLAGTAFIANLYNAKDAQYPVQQRFPAGTFTPEALAGEGVR